MQNVLVSSMLNVYDFSSAPVQFDLNGLPMHRVKRIEFSVEMEETHVAELATPIYIATHSGKWRFSLENGKDLILPQEGIVVSFHNLSMENKGTDKIKVTVNTLPDVHPVSEDSKEFKVIEGGSGAFYSWPETSAQTGYGRRDEVDKLPGIKENVKHPVTQEYDELEDIIIDLNDDCKWTRYEIADWLETLDIDIRFKIEETKE